MREPMYSTATMPREKQISWKQSMYAAQQNPIKEAKIRKLSDLVKMNPVVPAVGTNGKPVPTDLGEALLVAPDVEYDIVVYLHQNVVATTDGKSEMKSYSYSTTLKNFNDEKAGFEHGRSYNVQISLWGLSQITVTTKLDKWNDGGNIDMPIEDLDVPRI